MALITNQKEPAMNLTIDPMIEQHVRESLAHSLCRLASLMPYCTDDEAREEYAMLDRRCSHEYLYKVTGVASWKALMEKAIIVRAAAEEVTA
jgi:hypothetical protein